MRSEEWVVFILLIGAAIEGMREMEIGLKKPVLKEFISPVKTKTDEKMNWMSSAQLWSDNSFNKNKAIDLKEVLKISNYWIFQIKFFFMHVDLFNIMGLLKWL